MQQRNLNPMLASSKEQPPAGTRSEFRRVPTSELPQLVDRILDNRYPASSPVLARSATEDALAEGPVRPSRTLLTVIRRLLERPIAEA